MKQRRFHGDTEGCWRRRGTGQVAPVAEASHPGLPEGVGCCPDGGRGGDACFCRSAGGVLSSGWLLGAPHMLLTLLSIKCTEQMAGMFVRVSSRELVPPCCAGSLGCPRDVHPRGTACAGGAAYARSSVLCASPSPGALRHRGTPVLTMLMTAVRPTIQAARCGCRFRLRSGPDGAGAAGATQSPGSSPCPAPSPPLLHARPGLSELLSSDPGRNHSP